MHLRGERERAAAAVEEGEQKTVTGFIGKNCGCRCQSKV